MGRVPVEYGNSPTVPAWRVLRKDAVTLLLARVDTARDLGLLEDPQVQVGIIHAL